MWQISKYSTIAVTWLLPRAQTSEEAEMITKPEPRSGLRPEFAF